MEHLLSEIQLLYVPSKVAVQKVKGARTAVDIFRQIWPPDFHIRERAYALYLNNSGIVLGWFEISAGGVSSAEMDPRLIFSAALKCVATQMIIAHNHPSGTLEPSKEDERMTTKLKQGGALLDIKLIDHIVLTDEAHFSFAEGGLI